MKHWVVIFATSLPLASFAQTAFARAPGSFQPTTTTSATEYDRAQVAAATANAYVNLRKDIERNWITPQLTVAEFVKRAGGEDALRAAVKRADMIGGPRWIDDQTCQVKVEMSGSAVAQALVEVAAKDPQRSMSPDELERRLADWDLRTFAATGTSIAADKVNDVRPIGVAAWRNVDDDSRIAAIAAARENAVNRVISDLRAVRLDDSSSIGDVLAKNDAITQRLADLLRKRPVTSIQFKDDLQIQFTLSVSRREVVENFLEAARKAGIDLPADATLEKLRAQFRQEITSTTGTAIARRAANAAMTNAQPAVVIPQQPPRWVFDQIDAEGHANFRSSLLHTKQDAEDSAVEAIRVKLLSQQLTQGTSMADAVERDPNVRRAVDRALSRAHTFKVDYDPSGSVTVKMSLDPRELWSDLSRP